MKYDRSSLYLSEKEKEETKPRICPVCEKPVKDEDRLKPFAWHKKCLDVEEDDKPHLKCIRCANLPHRIPASQCPTPKVCKILKHIHLKEGEKCPHCEARDSLLPENLPLPMGCAPTECPLCGGKIIDSATDRKKWVTYITPTGGHIRMRR